MLINFEKLIHTETGKYLISIILGFGLASLFREMCNGNNCIIYHAPPLDKLNDKIYKYNNKCVKYNMTPSKCLYNNNNTIINFE